MFIVQLLFKFFQKKKNNDFVTLLIFFTIYNIHSLLYKSQSIRGQTRR